MRLVEASAWQVLFWRSLFMAIFLFSWGIIKDGFSILPTYYRTVMQGKWVTIFFTCSIMFYVFSITNTTVADSLLIQGTAPILIVFLGWLLLGEPLKRITVAGILAVALGISIIMIPSLDKGGLSGNFFGLAKAGAFAAGTIAIRKRKSIALLPAITSAAALTALISLFFVPSFTLTYKSLFILGYLGFFQTGIAFLFFTSYSGKLSSSLTGLIVILEAVLGPLWVWLFLSERPPDTTLIGGSVIITALVTHTLLFNRGNERKIKPISKNM